MFPHIENCLTMTLREWLYFHNVMHRHYTRYHGRRVLKNPFDWMVMMDIIQDTRPSVIIEIGTFEGAFALWMAHFLDSLNLDTQIIGIDVNDLSTNLEHPRIKWIIGDALSKQTITQVEEATEGRRGMVVEDSDHKYHITKQILHNYEKFVAQGCYLIVEDTIVEFLKLPPFPGPLHAVKEFVEERKSEFVIDRSREKYIMTYNPMGYLLRVS